MKTDKERNLKRNIYRYLTLFLFFPLLFNIVGNFIGLSSQYTFYHYGYNLIAIVSRIVENAITAMGWRIFLLGLITMLSSVLMYFLYYFARKGRVLPLILGAVIYLVDALAVFSPYYLESPNGLFITNFIHLVMFSVLFVGILLYLLISPERRKSYDHP